MNYLLADFLIRIKNAYMAGRQKTVSPWSKMLEVMALLLKKNNFIKGYTIVKKGKGKVLSIDLFGHGDAHVGLKTVKLFSKPGRRFYSSAIDIPYPKEGRLVIISTSKGIMAGRQARQKNIGGEVLAELG